VLPKRAAARILAKIQKKIKKFFPSKTGESTESKTLNHPNDSLYEQRQFFTSRIA